MSDREADGYYKTMSRMGTNSSTVWGGKIRTVTERLNENILKNLLLLFKSKTYTLQEVRYYRKKNGLIISYNNE